ASLKFLLITRRMRSDPASGAIVTDFVPPAASAFARRGVITSAFNEDGETRPPAAATRSQVLAMPGWLAISAPTSPIVDAIPRPASASRVTPSWLRWRTGRYMKPAAQKRQPHSHPRLASTRK